MPEVIASPPAVKGLGTDAEVAAGEAGIMLYKTAFLLCMVEYTFSK